LKSKTLSKPSKYKPGDRLNVKIEKIVPNGYGLSFADGLTVFTALAAVGDQLVVEIGQLKHNTAFAEIVEVIKPSPDRIEPPCIYFGTCGGCDFQQLNYQAQLDAKVEIIRDCLRRLGGIEDVPAFEITAAPHEWHYRARAQWQYDGVLKRLGYFEANSHRVCDVAECAVLTPELQSELERLRRRMSDDDLPDDARYFRAIAGDEEVSIVDDRGNSPIVRDDSSDIKRTICGEVYGLNAESFFQTNIQLLPSLIDAALLDAQGDSAIELYSGVGLFTVPLARRFKRVIAIEDDADATDFARENLAHAGLQNTEVVNADVGELDENADDLEAVDFLLLDPPRTGAESRVISGILKLKPQRISYVSCDPATMARDLKKLIAGGYAIQSLRAFDMFPQTHHVETVVHLYVDKNTS